jgi:hypothetical protein
MAFNIQAYADEPTPYKPSQTEELLSKLESSWQALNLLNKQSGSSYKYSIRTDSWAGFGSKTTVTVEKGKVTSRIYSSWNKEGEEDIRWQELTPAEIGKHKQGFTPVTLTYIYEECITRIRCHNPHAGQINLRLDENNLLKICTYTPIGCADDCAEGVNINSIEFIK